MSYRYFSITYIQNELINQIYFVTVDVLLKMRNNYTAKRLISFEFWILSGSFECTHS